MITTTYKQIGIKTTFKTRTILGMTDCTAEKSLSIDCWKSGETENFIKFLRKSINMFSSDKYLQVNVELYYTDKYCDKRSFALIDDVPFSDGVFKLYKYDIDRIGTDVIEIAKNKLVQAIVEKINSDINLMDAAA